MAVFATVVQSGSMRRAARELSLTPSAGCGVSFNVVPEIADDLKRRRLLRVLPKWSAPSLSVDALMLRRATQPAKVRQAVDALVRYLSTI